MSDNSSLQHNNLYLVEISEKIDYLSYDTYDSFIVCCENEEQARKTYPNGICYLYCEDKQVWLSRDGTFGGIDAKYEMWIKGIDIAKLIVTHLGIANKDVVKGVILASFNAG